MLMLYLSMLRTEEERSFFTKLYNDYRHAMYCFANKYLNDPAASEDIVHDVFCIIADDHLKNLSERTEDGRRRFLFVCVKNRALNHIKTRSRNVSIDTLSETGWDVQDSATDPIDEIIANEDMVERAKVMIKSLDPIYADALWLSLEGLTAIEISKLFKENHDTVRKRIYRAKQQLRELVLKEGGAA